MLTRYRAWAPAAALVGVLVLFAAGDARAAFATGDLEGAWLYFGFSQEIDQNRPGWTRGRFTADASGDISEGQERDSTGAIRTMVDGELSIDSDGYVSGTFEFESASPGSFSDFKMASAKTMLVGLTADDNSRAIVVVFKAGGSFADADVEGLWHFHSYWDDMESNHPGWTRGHYVVDAGGAITGGEQTSSDGVFATISGGGVAIDAEGYVSGVLEYEGGGSGAFSAVKMDRGKEVMAGAQSTDGGSPFVTVVVKGGGSFATADLEGTWTLHDFRDDLPANDPRWTRGPVDVDAAGTITGGSVVEDNGDSVEITGGSMSADEDGFVSGTVEVAGGGSSTFAGYKMDPGHQLTVGVESQPGTEPSITILVPEPRSWLLRLAGVGCVFICRVARSRTAVPRR